MLFTRWIPLCCLFALGAWQYALAQHKHEVPANAAKRELQALLDQLVKGDRSEREFAASQLRECSELVIERLIEIAKQRPVKAPPMNRQGEREFERWNPPRALAFQLLGDMRTLRAISVAADSIAYKPEFLLVRADEGLGRLRSFPAAFLVFQLQSAGIYALLEDLATRPNQDLSDGELTTLVELFKKSFNDKQAAVDYLSHFMSKPSAGANSTLLARLRFELGQ